MPYRLFTITLLCLALLPPFFTYGGDETGFGHIRTLKGHKDAARSVAFSPDGKLIASGSYDKTIRLWNVSTGQCLRTLRGHTGSIFSVAFSPDGELIAGGSNDKTVRLWNAKNGRLLRTLEGHTDWIWSVAFSPDGALIASGSHDETIRLWEVATGRLLRTLGGHTGFILSVAFSPDGKLIASGSRDKTIRLWNARTSRLIRTLEGHTGYIQSVAFSPDGKLIVSGGDDKTIRLWNAKTGSLIRTLEGHKTMVESVAFSPDGKLIVSGSSDKTIRLWEVATGRRLRTLKGHENDVLSVAFSPDGALIASGSYDGTIRLWERVIPRGLPPNLFAELDFADDNGNGILEAAEEAEIRLRLTNEGRGPAWKLMIAVKDDHPDMALTVGRAEVIIKLDPGESQELTIPLSGGYGLETARHRLKIEVREHFHYDMNPAYLVLTTRSFDPPRLVFSGLEIIDSGADVGPIVEDGRLQAGEYVKARIVVQNVGQIKADEVVYRTTSEDPEIYLDRAEGELGTLEPGEVKEFQVAVSPTKRFSSEGKLPVYLQLSESTGRGGLENFQLPIQLDQAPPAVEIFEVKADLEKLEQQLEIARFEFTSSKFTARNGEMVNVRTVPLAKTRREHSVAVVIGVEDYELVPPAPYAGDDAELIAKYFERRLGVEQVVIYRDKEVSGFFFDDIFDPVDGELTRAVLPGVTELFVFYSGHGVPNKDGSDMYLFPADGKIKRLEQVGYSLNKLYQNLNKMGAKSVTVVLDACFSGVGRATESKKAENLIASRPVGLRLVKPYLQYDNFTVITSAAGSETSLGYDKAKSGLFTYFFAAGLRGEADDNGDSRITLGELKRYVIDNVTETSRKIYGLQTPQFYGDESRVLVNW